MNIYSKTIAIIQKAIEEVDREMDRRKPDAVITDNVSMPQLGHIRDVLKAVVLELESGNLRPKSERHLGIGRFVVDSWPHELSLGESLIDAERAYYEC
jgi:hypothetical protein